MFVSGSWCLSGQSVPVSGSLHPCLCLAACVCPSCNPYLCLCLTVCVCVVFVLGSLCLCLAVGVCARQSACVCDVMNKPIGCDLSVKYATSQPVCSSLVMSETIWLYLEFIFDGKSTSVAYTFIKRYVSLKMEICVPYLCVQTTILLQLVSP